MEDGWKWATLQTKEEEENLQLSNLLTLAKAPWKVFKVAFFFVIVVLETSIGKAVTPMLAPFWSPHKRPPKIQYTYREKKINKGKKEGAINGKICVENVMSDANVD